MRIAVCLIISGLIACAAAQQPEFKKRPTEPAHETPSAPIRDQSRTLPTRGLKHSGIVLDHVAGISKLPGGTVGDYENGGRNYQIFIIDARADQQAAFMLLDVKGVLKDPEYLASFGGYFGTESSRPVFVFAKQRFLAGIVGLPKEQADPIARTLASRLQ